MAHKQESESSWVASSVSIQILKNQLQSHFISEMPFQNFYRHRMAYEQKSKSGWFASSTLVSIIKISSKVSSNSHVIIELTFELYSTCKTSVHKSRSQIYRQIWCQHFRADRGTACKKTRQMFARERLLKTRHPWFSYKKRPWQLRRLRIRITQMPNLQLKSCQFSPPTNRCCHIVTR